MSIVEKIIIITISTMLFAQILKFIIHSLIKRTIDEGILVSTGGMPSSHSALVTSLVCSIYIYDGVGYPFVISLILALVVIHDSFGVRYEASKHAKDINIVKAKLNLIDNIETEEKKLKESLGHKPIEVIAGIVLGVIMAIIGNQVL